VFIVYFVMSQSGNFWIHHRAYNSYWSCRLLQYLHHYIVLFLFFWSQS